MDFFLGALRVKTEKKNIIYPTRPQTQKIIIAYLYLQFKICYRIFRKDAKIHAMKLMLNQRITKQFDDNIPWFNL